ncbi:MAG: DUF2173 family protein [Deltaproteobacteria bacterium]|nr:DUF2173 family protein [Deltaproteobacteria bacterium]
MIGLDRLMEKDGVVAAGQFAEDGSVVRAVGQLNPEEMKRVAKICAEHSRGAQAMTDELDKETPLEWKGLNGWVLWGGKYALCVSGDTGVFVESTRADFNQLLVDLFGPPAAGMRMD